MTASSDTDTTLLDEPLPTMLPVPFKKRRHNDFISSSDEQSLKEASGDPDVFITGETPPASNLDMPALARKRSRSLKSTEIIDLTLDDNDKSFKKRSGDLVDLTDTPGTSTFDSKRVSDQSSFILKCLPNTARFTLKHASTLRGSGPLPKHIRLTGLPEGVEITGSSDDVQQATRILRSIHWHGDRYSCTCPNLTSHFSSDSWTDFVKVLENEIRCTVTLKCDPATSKNNSSDPKSPISQSQNTKLDALSPSSYDFHLLESLIERSITPPPQSAPETSCAIEESYRWTKYGTVTIAVARGDIIDDDSDFIVNGVDENFDLNIGSISQALLNKAGNEMQILCYYSYWSNNPLIRVTDGKNLRCNHVLHLVTSHRIEDYAHRFLLALNCAETFGATSVAFPTLGVGRINLDPVRVSQEMVKALEVFTATNPVNVKQIKIVVFLKDIFPIFSSNLVTWKELNGYGNRRALITESESDASHVLETTAICIDSDWAKPVQLAKTRIESHMNKYVRRKRLSNDVIGMVGDHDCIDIYEAAKRCKTLVTCNLSYSEVDLVGLTDNVNKLHEFIRDLWCELHEAQTKAKLCQWKWECSYNEFVDLPIRVSCVVEKEFEKNKVGRVEVRLFGETLKLNFLTMTYNYRTVGGRLHREDKIGGGLAALPNHWTDMFGQSWTRVPLEPHTTGEYEKVIEMFRKTIPPPDIKVLKIERIQNPSLYKQYLIKKLDVKKHMCSSNPLERELFHGTSEQDIEKICAEGFDRGFAGKNATNYGKGSYFAVNSSYSLNYARRNRKKIGHMFLANVLTGDFTQGRSSYKAAPEKPPSGSGVRRLYDSVVDCIDSPIMFVVFKDSSVYPTYLITFT